ALLRCIQISNSSFIGSICRIKFIAGDHLLIIQLLLHIIGLFCLVQLSFQCYQRSLCIGYLCLLLIYNGSSLVTLRGIYITINAGKYLAFFYAFAFLYGQFYYFT